jgi:predicted phosphodiesterase
MHLALAAVLAAWLQYAADGTLHARAIASDACPAMTTQAGDVAMTPRAQATKAFPTVTCEAPVTQDGPITIGGIALQHPPALARVDRVVVLGDTGCRVKDKNIQACNDPVAWPFAAVAAAVAKEKPDLIVHVGDYLYRESPCPPADASCAGPSGDTWATWNADFFTPGAPMLHAAPLVMARGNHESCKRGGLGWFQYLEPTAATACVEYTEPYAVQVNGLRTVVFDDSFADDAKAMPADVAIYAPQLVRAHALAGAGPTWFVTHRPPYMNADMAAASTDGYAGFQALIAGHIHVFGAFTLDGRPPLVINGMGGDTLSRGRELGEELTLLSQGKVLGEKVDEGQFGYAVYERLGDGWRIALHAADGRLLDRCTLANGAAHCDGQTRPQ